MTDHPPKRAVFTDGIKNRFAFQDYADGVYAIVGPFSTFTSDTALQDGIVDLVRLYNLEHGHLSKDKYRKLARGERTD